MVAPVLRRGTQDGIRGGAGSGPAGCICGTMSSVTKAPRVLVTGMPRGGSTRLYNVIREVLLSRHPQARASHFGHPDVLEAALEDPAPGIFKEHVFTEGTAQRIRRGDVIAVATLRDPLAALVSLCSAFAWEPEIAVNEVDRSLVCLEGVSSAARIYTYRTSTTGWPWTVRSILTDVGLPSSMVQATLVSHRWSKRRARSLSTHLKSSGLTHDPVNLLHPGHVDGVRGVDSATHAVLQEAVTDLHLDRRVAELQRCAR